MSIPTAASPLEASPVSSSPVPLLQAVPASPSQRESPPKPGELYSQLIAQVHTAVDDGVQVPCVGSDAAAWTSDDPTDQERAADRCWDCPLVFQCRAYAMAAGETAGVWGGFAPEIERARSKRPYRPSAEARQRAKERRRALRAARKAEAEQGDCVDAYAYILMGGEVNKDLISKEIGHPVMDANAIATEIPLNTCACGTCNEPVGRKAIYRPGHDARHVSVVLGGLINEISDGRKITKALIRTEAKNLPTEALRAKFTRAAERLMAKQPEDNK